MSCRSLFAQVLLELIEEGGVGPGLEKQKGNLLYYMAGKVRSVGGRVWETESGLYFPPSM